MRPFDAQGKFVSFDEQGKGLRRLAIRGAGVTVFASGALTVVQMAGTIVLARILTPSDFGVVAMVTAFSVLLTYFPGFTEAVLQWEEIDHHLISNLFWICLATGMVLTLGFASAGPLLARFYGSPLVGAITIAASFQILLTSTSVLHLALLKRGMRFSVVSANDAVARGASILVPIVLALAGFGYWSLIGGILAYPFVRAVGAWWLCHWIPSVPRRRPGTMGMLRFVAHVYGRYNIEYISHNMDNVLVGWRFGAHPLGLYKKAYDLFALPSSLLVDPVTAVAVAALSRLKDDAIRYRRYLLRALTVTAFLGMGIGADLTLMGRDLIRLLLGPNWGGAGRIFIFLGPGVGLMFLYAAHSWIHLSIGTAKRFFRWGLVEIGVTGILFALGLAWGPEGIAAAWTLSYGILIVPAIWYAGKPIGLGGTVVMGAVWRYMVASVLAGCVSFSVVHSLSSLATLSGVVGAGTRVVTISVLFGTLYLAAVVLLHWSWEPLRQFVLILGEMLPSRLRLPAWLVPANTATESGHATNAARPLPSEEVSDSSDVVASGVQSPIREGL